MLEYLEIGSTTFGLIQGLLIMWNKRSNWIAYVIQMAFLVAFSALNHLYGDVVNNSIYVVLGIIGYIMWKKGNKQIPEFCTAKQRGVYILVIFIGTVLLGAVLGTTNDPLPLLDAFTTVSSLVATYYMVTKKIDTWFIWFVNDIAYAIEYYILPDQAIYLFWLNVIWAFMAVGSFLNWNRIRKKNSMNKLFCAGAFNFDYLDNDYREKAKTDYRSILLGSENLLLEKHAYISLKENLSYMGPFYFEAEGMTDKLIVDSEIKMIKKCTHAIFLLDGGCCPGTIAELILASDLNKNVEIFFIKRNDNEETESILHSPCWFAIIMSKLNNPNTKITSCSDYKDATEKILNYISNFK